MPREEWRPMKSTRYILVLCLVLSLGGWGCQSKATSTSQAEATATAGAESDPTAVNEGLPIQDISLQTVAAEDPNGKALLSVAHAATGIPDDEPFYVWQLYVQGNSAVGDLQGSTSGRRLLVAFEHDGTAWNAVYQKKFIDASEAELQAACPSVTDELAQRVDFVVPVPVIDRYLWYRDEVAQLADYVAGAGAEVVMYAPTRLPEGFTLDSWDPSQLNNDAIYPYFRVNYLRGEDQLVLTPFVVDEVGGEYLEFDWDSDYENLIFGPQTAVMDSDCVQGEFPGPGWDEQGPRGPVLMSAYSYVQGTDVSPGMVAAVAESMVPLTDAVVAGLLVPPLTASLTSQDLAPFTEDGGVILWKGQDKPGNWWVLQRITDAIPDTYYRIWVRDSMGEWHHSVEVQGGIQIGRGSFEFVVPAEVRSAVEGAGVSVYEPR